MRRAAKVDANHSEIVKRFRSWGCSVQSLAAIGKGCPDLLVGCVGVNLLIEVKDGAKPRSRRGMTSDQVEWHRGWQGASFLAESVDDVDRIVEGTRQWFAARYEDAIAPRARTPNGPL